MHYDVTEGILKNGSLTAKIYFLLLTKPMTVSEISRIVYNGKVQLAHINRIINNLSEKDYISEYSLSREERREKSIDLRNKYWKSNYKPIIEFSEQAVIARKKGSPSKLKKNLTEKEAKALNLIFNSKWFSKFYEENFLKTQHGEICKINNYILSEVPIRFFAFFLEELFAISSVLQRIANFSINEDDLLKEPNFDSFIEKNQGLINEKIKIKISRAIKNAKENLGDYESTNKAIDYYIRDFAILFIPKKLSEKMSSIGRIPLTVYLAFHYAVGGR